MGNAFVLAVYGRGTNTNSRCNRTPLFDRSFGMTHACNLPYLHGEPLPGRRHPVKAASREAGARDARQP
jgi:hypothetical protein